MFTIINSIINKVELTAKRCPSPSHYQSLKRNFNHESETENNKRLGVWRN